MKIEEYIRQNRNKLDVENADEDFLWAGISQSFIKPKRSKRMVVLQIAASVLLFIGLSYAVFELSIIRNNQELILKNIDPKLARQEAQFQKQINTYYNTLIKTNFDKDQLATSFNELQNIDDMIHQYSEDLKNHGANPKILNSLMDLYQKKILVLDRMLNEIEKNKNYENNKTQI
ncbi:MAG: hypothetical protein A2W99_05610 [Bacteroidetes bacterium GWF2_33_16]|nr:MAG: hypothetical protein A2X00_13285 [Bacteroidetes bacterium GWE2_32_14]OFY05165.1 MAG: hypothetical protein A2W99_05610 [Bacteroidetes bacterium GWF2_33_16]